MATDETPTQDAPLNAVIVTRTFGEAGSVQANVQLSGDVRPTEVETILKLGLKGWLAQVGLS